MKQSKRITFFVSCSRLTICCVGRVAFLSASLLLLITVGTACAAELEVTPIDWSRFAGPATLSKNAQLNREVVQHFDYRLMTINQPIFAAMPKKGGYTDFGEAVADHIRWPAFDAFSLAVSLKTGAYDSNIAGFSSQDALAFARVLTLSVAVSHKSNQKGGWGDQWQSALWASSAGMAGWLLWDDLPTASRQNVALMVEYEANRFLKAQPPYWNGLGDDSKTEENSWNATVLDLAVNMMPTHEHAGAWLEKASEYRLSASARPSDLQSDEMYHGRPLSEWIDGYNIYADGSVVNHGIAPHPTYSTSTVKHNMRAALNYGLAGHDTPASATLNLDLMYYNLVKQVWTKPAYAAPGGTIYQNDGTIYWPDVAGRESNRRFKYYLFATTDAMVNLLDFGDLAQTDAADWEALHWGLTRWQQRNPDAPGSSDGIAGYNPAHGAATAWLAHFLGSRDAIQLSNAPLSAWAEGKE